MTFRLEVDRKLSVSEENFLLSPFSSPFFDRNLVKLGERRNGNCAPRLLCHTPLRRQKGRIGCKCTRASCVSRNFFPPTFPFFVLSLSFPLPSFASGKSPLENLIRPRREKGGKGKGEGANPRSHAFSRLCCYHQGRGEALLPPPPRPSCFQRPSYPFCSLILPLSSLSSPSAARDVQRTPRGRRRFPFHLRRKRGRLVVGGRGGDCARLRRRRKIIKVCSDPTARRRRSKRSQGGGGEVCSSRHSGAEAAESVSIITQSASSSLFPFASSSFLVLP